MRGMEGMMEGTKNVVLKVIFAHLCSSVQEIMPGLVTKMGSDHYQLKTMCHHTFYESPELLFSIEITKFKMHT